MTKTFKSRLLGVLISLLVLLTGFLGVSLGLGDTAKVAFADTTCTYENGFCTTHSSDSDCYYEACTQNSDGYYEIANAGNLFWYAKQVNADTEYYYGRMKGKITVDEIDLGNRPWTPIGSAGCQLSSDFDGNGATISGLNLTATGDYNGLFGKVGSCTIKDLTVKGKIDIAATDSNAVNYLGGVIGWGDGGTKLENVTSYVDINDTNSEITSADKQQRIGGVAGYIQSATIKNCNYYGTMTMQMAIYGAGIVGFSTSSTVDHCNNYGTVTFQGESKHIGGVVGHMESNTNVTCCANYSDVTSGGDDCIGGVVGYISNGTIENCANIGNVNCTYELGGYVGGILGYVNYDNLTSLKNCFNYGKISSTEGTHKHIGAIIGWCRALTVSKTDNNYYLDTSCEVPSDTTTINATAMNADQFECGKVAYLLNNGKTDGTQVWYQELDSYGDDYPVFSGETVYYTRIGGCCEDTYVYGYRNTDINATTHGYGSGINYAETDSGDTWEFNVYCNDCGELIKKCVIERRTLYYDGVERNPKDFYTITYYEDMPSGPDCNANWLVGFVFYEDYNRVYYAPSNTETFNRVEYLNSVGTYEYRMDFHNYYAKYMQEYTEDVLFCNLQWQLISNFGDREDGAYNYRKLITVENAATILPSTLNVTFEDYDGSVITEIEVDGSNPDALVVPTYTIPSNDYYTFTFKSWYCEQTKTNYASDELPTYEELFNAGYTDVTFKAVYDIKYKKSFELVGSIDDNTGLSDSVIYTKGENVKIVDKNSGDVNVYVNYKIATNDGVAALLLIPEYDSKFTISAVSVNGQSVYGSGATSNEVLSGWTATVTGSETTTWDTFKILLEQLPASTATGDMFIQIVYTMSADDVATGEYNFGFVTKYYSDTADTTTDSNLSHNDRSEAYGVLSGDEIASLCEVKISVTDANIIIVKRQNASLSLVNNNVVYDSKEVGIVEDCYYKANGLEEQIKNELAYHYSAYGTTLVNGDKWDWLQYIEIVAWYDQNGTKLDSAPINVGQYKVGISAKQNDYFNAVEEKQFDFVIAPYTIDVTVAQPENKIYNADAQTWVNDTFDISYVDGKAAFEGDKGYTVEVTDNTKDTTTGNYYVNGDVVRNWAGTYTVTLTFKVTDNYTFKEQTVSGASVTMTEDGKTKTVTFEVEILKYAVTVSAANKESQYSDNLASLSYGHIIDKGGVLLKDLPGQANVLKLLYKTTATNETNCGTYPITISVDENSSAKDSYDFTFIHKMCDDKDTNGNNGTYTITQKVIDIPTIADLTYNGLEQFPEVTSEATVNGKVAYAFSGDKQINAGKYTLTATLTTRDDEESNYKWNSETIAADKLDATIDWKIVAVKITVTIGDYTTEYSDELATITPRINPENGLQNGETLESIGVTYIIGNGSDEAKKDDYGKLPVGTYVITANYNGSNYVITWNEGSYEVTKKILDDEDLAKIIEQIVGATKEYTGSELTWVYNDETKDFEILGDLNGIAYSDIISITAVAAQDDDYTNANGKLDNDNAWTYWDPETKLYYTVSIKVNDTNSYMLYADENGNAVTVDSVNVEVFIKQATNVWATTPYVNAQNIENYEHGADAKFKAKGEVTIVITDSEGNEVAPEDLVFGTNYTITFTVIETNNYTGLREVQTFTLAGRVQIDRPTVYLDKIGGTVYPSNGGTLWITYDGKGHTLIVNPEDTTKYTVKRNLGGYSEPWTNVGDEYSIAISLNDNYEWKDGTHGSTFYILQIKKAELTVTANTYNVPFGTAIEKYETTASGFVNGETYATYGTIDVNSYLACSYVAGNQEKGKVGNYKITFGGTCQSDLDALLTNYNVTLVGGYVNVTAMNLNLDLSNLQGKFDSEDFALWTSLVASGYSVEYNATEHVFYLNSESYPEQLVPTITYSSGSDLPKNAGNYTISVTFDIKDGLDKNNYSWNNPEDMVTLTITKVQLTFTALDQTVYYDGELLYNDILNQKDWTVSPTFDEKPFMKTEFASFWLELEYPGHGEYDGYDLGTYENAIIVRYQMATGYSEDNYDITFVKGTLTYEKGTLTWEIKLTTVDREYNGKAISVGSEESPVDYFAKVDLSNEDSWYKQGELTYSFYTKDGEAYTEISAPSIVGTYYVKAVYTDTIHVDLVSDYVAIVISKASVSITATAENRNYLQDLVYGYASDTMNKFGGNEQSVTYEFSNDNGATWVSNPENKWFVVGTYQVKAIVNESENYQGAEDTATFTISKATLYGVEFSYDKDTATWDAITQTTNDEDINKYGKVTVTYKVDGTALTELSYTATGTGIYELIATIEGNDNFFGSTSTMVEVFSVEFADKEENHRRTETVYDFSKVAPTQYRFSGQMATQPDCCNTDADPITIAGYTFAKKWELNPTTIYGFTTGVTGNITLYALWDINIYTVTWMNDNDEIYTEKYEYLEEIHYKGDKPERATTDEYAFEFAGWSLTIDGEKIELSAVTDNIAYYAYYTKEGVTYAIVFKVSEDGGEYKEYHTNSAIAFGTTLTTVYNLADVTWFRGDVWYADEARTQVITTMPVAKDGITVYGAYVFDIGNGDVNADGQITTDDITIYREWVVGGYEMTIVESGNEWDLVKSDDFKADDKYFLLRVADVNADTSDDIRDITTIRMSIVTGYGYEIASGVKMAKVSGQAVRTIYVAPAVELNYTFSEGDDVTLVEQDGKVIEVDYTQPVQDNGNGGIALPSGGVNVFSVAVSGIDTEYLASGAMPSVKVEFYKGEIAEENKFTTNTVYATPKTVVDDDGNFTVSVGINGYGLELCTYVMTIDVTYQGFTYLQSEFTVTFYKPLTYTFSESQQIGVDSVYEVEISEDGKTITIDKNSVKARYAVNAYTGLFNVNIDLGKNIGDGTTEEGANVTMTLTPKTRMSEGVNIGYGRWGERDGVTGGWLYNDYTYVTADDGGVSFDVDFAAVLSTIESGEYMLSITVKYGNFTWKTAEYNLVLENF